MVRTTSCMATFGIRQREEVHRIGEVSKPDAHVPLILKRSSAFVGELIELLQNFFGFVHVAVSSTNRTVLEAIQQQDNSFKGKTTDQIDKLRRAMKIEVLPHRLCLHHPLRGDPCAQDGVCLGCNYFLAPAEMLPQYKERLARVEDEIRVPRTSGIIYIFLN